MTDDDHRRQDAAMIEIGLARIRLQAEIAGLHAIEELLIDQRIVVLNAEREYLQLREPVCEP